MYFGSIRFFKHLILTILILLIVVPTALFIFYAHQFTSLRDNFDARLEAAIQAHTQNGVENEAEEVPFHLTEEGKFLFGGWNDNVYTNEFADMTFVLPDGWNYREKAGDDFRVRSFFAIRATGPQSNPSLVTLLNRVDVGTTAESYLQRLMYNYENDEENTFIINSDVEYAYLGGYSVRTFYLTREDGRYMRFFAREVEDYMLSISIVADTTYDIDSVLPHFGPFDASLAGASEPEDDDDENYDNDDDSAADDSENNDD